MDNTLSKDMNSNSSSNSNSNSNSINSESPVSSPCGQALRHQKRELSRAKHKGNVVRRRRLQMFPGGEKGESSGVGKKEREKKENSTVVFWEDKCPKFAHSSVCGRRRYMEDFVAIHPSICSKDKGDAAEFHYFAVYDGHGCSHVASWCKRRLHELLKEELAGKGTLEDKEWKYAMEQSFKRVDEEVVACKAAVMVAAGCRCLLPSPESDAVGSTAVVALVTPDKIIVANCGDSRAVLSRKGRSMALTSDQKPDRPDELARIQDAGGCVIHYGGARVLGVLAMSRAIGDKILKPYVMSKPEVAIIDRTTEDDCLILASDGLWDTVSNQTACGVARMCLDGKVGLLLPLQVFPGDHNEENTDVPCEEASVILTKLALIRNSTDNVSVVVVNLKKDV